MVLALLNAGADPSTRDASGQRPVDFARENDAITGSRAYRRLLVGQPSPLMAGRSATGILASTDGVRWGLAYYDEWSYSAIAGQRIVVAMDSGEVDAYLLVLRDDGTEIASDDDGEKVGTLAWSFGRGRLGGIRFSQRALSPKRRDGTRSV